MVATINPHMWRLCRPISPRPNPEDCRLPRQPASSELDCHLRRWHVGRRNRVYSNSWHLGPFRACFWPSATPLPQPLRGVQLDFQTPPDPVMGFATAGRPAVREPLPVEWRSDKEPGSSWIHQPETVQEDPAFNAVQFCDIASILFTSRVRAGTEQGQGFTAEVQSGPAGPDSYDGNVAR